MKKILLYILIISFNFIYAQKIESLKNIDKTYKINRNSILNIKNKYGSIYINNWEKDSIEIKINISVKSKNKEISDKNLQLIITNIKQLNDSIVAETIFKNNFSQNSKVIYTIDYHIKSPIYINLNLDNTYGNIHINELRGLTNIKLSYGKLFAKSLNFNPNRKLSKFDLSYCISKIDYCNYGEFNIKYGTFRLTEGKAVKINSNYTNLKLTKLQTLYLKSNYGTCRIDSLEITDINAKYLDVNIEYLNSKLKLNLIHGDCNINNISPFFNNIDIKAREGNLSLLIHPNAVYQLNAIIKQGEIEIPRKANLKKIYKKDLKEIKGVVGTKDKNITGKVKIDLTKGRINL